MQEYYNGKNNVHIPSREETYPVPERSYFETPPGPIVVWSFVTSDIYLASFPRVPRLERG